MANEIRVRDTGPVEEFAYQINGYGLHVLYGPQGAGKTTVLRSVQLAVDGRTDVRPSKRDGAARGEISVCGKTIRIMKQVREEGELTVDGLGDISIADLHSPPYKDAVTRDRHRVKTLVRIAGVKADASLFWSLLGGQENFEAIIPVDSLTTDDLVEMAARVKRAIERRAQEVEERERTELANARAQAAIAESVDTTAPNDADELQAALERAIRSHAQQKEALASLQKRAADAATAGSRAEKARAKLEAIGGGLTIAEAEARLTSENANLATVESQIARLEQRLTEAKQARREVIAKRDAAEDALEAARREEALHAELHAVIDAANSIVAPTADEIEDADYELRNAGQRLEMARDAQTEGVRIREALAAAERAEKHSEAAKKLAARARRLRDAASDTLTVLSNAIASINDCPLRVLLTESGDPRLVLSTDRSESEPLDELSDGEKWALVVQIAAGANRLIVLPQSAYGELSPSTRRQLHELAKQHQCYVLTAIADDCPLHGEAFESVTTEAAE